MRFWAAWEFLTIIPAPRRREFVAQELGRSVAFFPVVGLVLGLVLLGLDRLMALFLPSFLINMLLVAALAILTGALHLDGFIDTCDGLAAKKSTQARLKVMGDSRVGGFGVVGGSCLILCKFASLVALPQTLRGTALVLMPVLSRWGMVGVISLFGAAKKQGMGWLVKREVNWKETTAATVFSLSVTLAFLGWWGAPVLAGLCLVVLGAAKSLCHIFGGLTGDMYGAICEFAEVAVLILFVTVGGLGGSGWLGSVLL